MSNPLGTMVSEHEAQLVYLCTKGTEFLHI